MNIIRSIDAPVFDAGGTTVTAYAAPSRGASEISLWRLELAPGSTSPRHRLDREEVFLGLEGEVQADFDGSVTTVGAGDCLIVPAHTPFSLHVSSAVPFHAVACLPAGGQATVLPGGPTFVPPWAQ
jgi:quercetin dioxygenase-like cupin family protein